MRILVVLMLFISTSFFSVQAQSQSDELQKMMQDMQQQMEEVFGTMGDFQIITDTSFIQQFDLGQLPQDGFIQIDSFMTSGSLEDMMKMMEEQMKQFSDQDLQNFQDLFRQFDGMMIPAPDGDMPKATPVEPKKKKKKTYKL